MKAIAMNDRISWIVFIWVWVMPYFLAISGWLLNYPCYIDKHPRVFEILVNFYVMKALLECLKH